MSLASSLSCGPVHGLLERPLGLTPFFFFFFLIISIFFFFFTHSLRFHAPWHPKAGLGIGGVLGV